MARYSPPGDYIDIVAEDARAARDFYDERIKELRKLFHQTVAEARATSAALGAIKRHAGDDAGPMCLTHVEGEVERVLRPLQGLDRLLQEFEEGISVLATIAGAAVAGKPGSRRNVVDFAVVSHFEAASPSLGLPSVQRIQDHLDDRRNVHRERGALSRAIRKRRK